MSPTIQTPIKNSTARSTAFMTRHHMDNISDIETLTDDDRAALVTIERAISIEEDAGLVITLVRAYYSDLDRSNRTPRMLVYAHLGVLLGIAQTCRDLYLSMEQK
jgi:hypothetical protein